LAPGPALLPSRIGMLQNSPCGHDGVVQQLPSTQFPETHWVPFVHPPPDCPVGVTVGVAVGCWVAVGVYVNFDRCVFVAVGVGPAAVGVAVAEGLRVTVNDGVLVNVAVRDRVGEDVGVIVGVVVGEREPVGVTVGVKVRSVVGVSVGVNVTVGVWVSVGVSVLVEVGVGV
jgi:hypothetical protein